MKINWKKIIDTIANIWVGLLCIGFIFKIIGVIYDSTNKSHSDDVKKSSTTSVKQQIIPQSLSEKTIPDYEFKAMNALNSSSKYYDLMCKDESNDFYCIISSYDRIGNNQKTLQKYLGKTVKVPFFIWSYSNNYDGTIYISDKGYVSEYQLESESSYCHLTDSTNIEKFVSESNNQIGDYNVVGVLSEIKSRNGLLVLDPCYYIGKHKGN